jgi:hypothetical protein
MIASIPMKKKRRNEIDYPRFFYNTKKEKKRKEKKGMKGTF